MEPAPEPLDVRRAELDDLDEVVPLFDAYRMFYRQPSQPAACRGFLEARLARGESVLLLARRAGAALGFVQLYPVFSSVRLRPAFLLNDLYVDPAARGTGVVDALLRAATAHASQAGAAFLLLETGDDNARAQSVYTRDGWQRIDPASRFYLKELA
ncbi:MAG: GNAT family N-acetyltransferase [Xanthomonadales bacterium]|nr:GNAT family N-acetyltransferase [Xanthomonadales bacterium]